MVLSNILEILQLVRSKNVLNNREDHFESGYFSLKEKDNWKALCSIVRKLFRFHREEINLKVESKFLIKYDKTETLEHNNFRDSILYITVSLTPLYSDNSRLRYPLRRRF